MEKARDELLSGITDPRIREQAYVLEVSEQGAAACAGGEPGLFYAAETLSQLVEQGRVPCIFIQDRPALASRAALLDISRGRVPRPEALRELIDLLARFKFNQLTFNLEHTFAARSHPQIGWGHDPITNEELVMLNNYAADHQVEIIPFQQSLGHLHHLLTVPEYGRLAYDQELLWSLDPGKPEIYDLLRDLYLAQIEATRSKFFHVGCDEPFDIMKHFDPSRFTGRSLGQVIRDHLVKLHEILAGQGRIMMAWADAVVAHPEIIPDLPEDLVLCHWLYGSGKLEGPEFYRPSLEILQKSGRPFYACTCSWSMMKIAPDLAVMRANHDSFVPEAKRAGAQGLMLTIWGDMGHMNLPGLETYALAYAARHAWEDAPEPNPDYRQPKPNVAEIIETLDQVNSLLGGPAGMAGVGFLLFFDEPLSIGVLGGLGDELLPRAEKLLAATEKARSLLAQMETESGLWSQNSWPDLFVPASQIEVLEKKLALIAFLKANWPGAKAEDKTTAAKFFSAAAKKCDELAGLIAATWTLLEARWLVNSKRSDIVTNARRYQRLIAAWQARAGEFQGYADAAGEGQAIPNLFHVLLKPPGGYAFNALQEMGLVGLL